MTTTTNTRHVPFPRPAWATETRSSIDGVDHSRTASVSVPDGSHDDAPRTLSLVASVIAEPGDDGVTVTTYDPQISLEEVGALSIDGARAMMAALTELVEAYKAAR